MRMVRQDPRPAVAVYDSIGSDFFLSPAPGWLNLGLWEGHGEEAEAEAAVQRLVRTVAEQLPSHGVTLDVANGLGVQDVVIDEVLSPSLLVALNLTESQLRAGRDNMQTAHAQPVLADAVRLPIRSGGMDGVISIEAAFHFSSRQRFFAEVRRVLRPGGRLAMSDISVERGPKNLSEAFAGLSNLRTWGIKRAALQSATDIRRSLEDLGFTDVQVDSVGERVFPPVIRFMRQREARSQHAPTVQRFGARVLLHQWELLYERGIMDYVLVSATSP